MKGIKFRAWNGEEMISPDYIDRNGVAWWKENCIPQKFESPMPYTGVRDVCGIEIYEGDIFKYSNGVKGIIVFASGSFKLRVSKDTVNRERSNLNHGVIWKRGVMVIGNIYEDSDLLSPQIRYNNLPSSNHNPC